MTAHSTDADRLLRELVNELGLSFPEAMRLRTTDLSGTTLLVEDKDRQRRVVALTERQAQLAETVRAGRRGGYLLDTGGMTSRHARSILSAA